MSEPSHDPSVSLVIPDEPGCAHTWAVVGDPTRWCTCTRCGLSVLPEGLLALDVEAYTDLVATPAERAQIDFAAVCGLPLNNRGGRR